MTNRAATIMYSISMRHHSLSTNKSRIAFAIFADSMNLNPLALLKIVFEVRKVA